MRFMDVVKQKIAGAVRPLGSKPGGRPLKTTALVKSRPAIPAKMGTAHLYYGRADGISMTTVAMAKEKGRQMKLELLREKHDPDYKPRRRADYDAEF
jgi:hypothetical protein